LRLTWPKESGGRAATPYQQAIYNDELARACAPSIIGKYGVMLAAPIINVAGTQWQKDAYLEPLLRGDEIWAQGFSEPGAGSDLANLQTKAVHVGDHWVLNGQKVWSSGAHLANRSFLLARTDPDAKPPHTGLGYFIVNLQQPGVDVRPIKQLSGEGEFCEIFLTDALVADDDLVGSATDGWKLAMMTFGLERAAAWNAPRFERAIEGLIRLAQTFGRNNDPVVRQRIALAHIHATVFRLSALRVLTRAQAGTEPGPEASVSKLFWSEMDQNLIQETAIAIQGIYGALLPDDPLAPDDGRWQEGWFWAQAETIFAGSSAIQRNIIAERVLGLPRGR
jgi:alkylation response protein AidB-like acyl-CoA dehydrogenase